MFGLILAIPIDTPESINIPITSSTRNDWGGDQNDYREFCGEPFSYFAYKDQSMEEYTYIWFGGCKV